MKEKIVKIEKGKEGVVLPDEYIRYLELIPGAEVEITLDKKNRQIIIKPLHDEDFIDHFKTTIETMA